MSIAITGLCKSFGGKTVLNGYDLQIKGPLVLMGPSGCGKTTLLRLLMGLEKPDAGQITGVGQIAAVFQEDRLCPQLSAADNICLVGASAEAARRELLSLGFTAAECAQPAAKLSGGQKRRVALLRALLCPGAETLLLDEPFTGMDAELIDRAAAAIARLTGGRDALLVTHDLDAVAALGWPVVTL